MRFAALFTSLRLAAPQFVTNFTIQNMAPSSTPPTPEVVTSKVAALFESIHPLKTGTILEVAASCTPPTPEVFASKISATSEATSSSTVAPLPAVVEPPAVICVFCGAAPGTSPAHLAAARELAHTLYAHGIHLVYGGGTSGLMGELARTLVNLSGPESVHGIIPTPLVKYERKPSAGDASNLTSINTGQIHGSVGAYGKVTQVEDMHTRKNMMAQEVMSGGPGSGFIALTGGFGTIEELMEIVTWNQLGIHGKGAVVFNVDGFWDGIMNWVKHATTSGFINQKNSGILVEAKTAEDAVKALREYKVSEGRFGLDWSKT